MSTALRLPRELTIYTVAELRPQWLDWLATWSAKAIDPVASLDALRSADVEATAVATAEATVEAAEVEEVDAAGVQLLLALGQSLQRQGHALALRDPSAALAGALVALGLGAHFRGAGAQPATNTATATTTTTTEAAGEPA